MVALSEPSANAFGVANGIAVADMDGASASAQAAAPINKKRFIRFTSLGRFSAARREVSAMLKVPIAASEDQMRPAMSA
jgi:hypothetical protein